MPSGIDCGDAGDVNALLMVFTLGGLNVNEELSLLRTLQPGSAQGFLLRRCVLLFFEPVLETFRRAQHERSLNGASIAFVSHRHAITLLEAPQRHQKVFARNTLFAQRNNFIPRLQAGISAGES